MSDEKYYRYVEKWYAGMPLCTVDGSEEYGPSTCRIELQTFDVIRHTPKGVWILDWNYTWDPHYERWIGHEHNKRYACETKELAMESFLARKRRQIHILRNQLNNALHAQKLGEHYNVEHDIQNNVL